MFSYQSDAGIWHQYRDSKRYLWLGSLLWPLLPLVSIALYWWTDQTLWFCAPLLLVYGVMPLADFLGGADDSNPPEEVVPQLEADSFYKYVLWATVPMHFVVLILVAAFVGTQELSAFDTVILALSAGTFSGLGINTGHELGHKTSKWEHWLAKIVLAVPVYGHFWLEHNRGHHRDVATPEDPASSRMGESIYRFALREIPGAWKRAWQFEAQRLARSGWRTWSIHNEILHSYAISAVLQISLLLCFGWIMVPFLVIHNLWAWFQLTSANYVEHYGLLRQKQDNGRYERCQPHHSWNANYVVSNLLIFHLERHSDHHAYPARRYQSLRSFPDLPTLPNGYFGMFVLAYIPWAWFRVMDPRVLSLKHVDGCLERVNVDPRHRARLEQQYGGRDTMLG